MSNPAPNPRTALKQAIRRHYHTSTPKFAYIDGGLRRIAVDPNDRRAQMQLLRHGVRYFSKMQAITYAINALLRPELFIDVGINYGECLFSLPLNSKTTVVGFEANPALIPLIERSCAYNDDLDVTVVPKAVSNVAGEKLTFFVNKKWSGKSTGVPTDSELQHIEKIEVPCTTIDQEILTGRPSPGNVLMKIDVEGLEPKVIAGAAGLISASDNIICLIEFDSKFLQSSTGTASEFFSDLQDTFEIYLVRRRLISRLSRFEDLNEFADSSGRVHCDLLLLKAGDPDFKAVFEKRFANRSVLRLVKDDWALGASGPTNRNSSSSEEDGAVTQVGIDGADF